jgi:mannose-6-phosphate isomerase-like protein (cupin superfamily)
MAEQREEHQPVQRVEKPWGFEVWFAITDRYAGKLIHIEAGEQLSLQFHERKDESLLVLSGELELELEDSEGRLVSHRLRPGQCQRIEPHQRHRMRAPGSAVEICEVSTPELDDVVRLQDRYGRVDGPAS